MNPESTIAELFEQIDSLPFGAQERGLIDRAIRLAEDAGDERLAYHARMRLTVSAKMTGDTDTMLSSFGWCLGMHESDPARFPQKIDQLDLLWQFKWMVGTLAASPLFPLAEIRSVIDEMTHMYRRANVGLSGVLQARFDEAVENGRPAEAAALRAELQSTDRDDYSHCEACVRSEDADYLASVGRLDEAIVKFDEIVDQNLSCGDEPEASMSRSLLPYLRSGNLAKAKSAHLRGYRLARQNDDNIGMIANHLVFCAVTGNEARGLTILERHIGWLAHDNLNAIAHFSTLRAIGVLLDAVVRAGHPDAVVRGAGAAELRGFFGEHSGEWTAAELSVAAWAAAERLANAFNDRNGNDHYSELLRRSRALADERYDVVIEGTGFSAPVPVGNDETPTDAGGWLVLASERAGVGEPSAALAAARSGLELAEAAPSDVVVALHSLVVGSLVRQDRFDEAVTALRERITVLRANGLDDQAWAEDALGLVIHGALSRDGIGGDTRAAIGALTATLDEAEVEDRAAITQADIALTLGRLFVFSQRADSVRESAETADRVDHGATNQEAMNQEAVRLFRLAIELAADHPLGDVMQSALMHLAVALVEANDTDRADVTLDHLLDLPIDRALRGAALHLRARLSGGRGDLAAALEDAEELLALHVALRNRRGIIDACTLSAPLLRDLGRVDEALPRWRLAIAQAELGESDLVSGLRFGLGRELVHAGHVEEAVDLLSELYSAEVAANEPPGSLAETLYWLGSAYRMSDDAGLAYGPWSRAVELYDEGGLLRDSAQTGLLLGRLLQEFEDPAAIETLDAAVETARRNASDIETLVAVVHTRGQVKCQFGDRSGLVDFDEVADIAERVSAGWLAADVLDSRARGLHRLGMGSKAVPLALQAADDYSDNGDGIAAGLAELFAARVLVEQQNREAAVQIYQSTRERLADQDQAFIVASLELGDALEALGRHAEASTVRAEAHSRQGV